MHSAKYIIIVLLFFYSNGCYAHLASWSWEETKEKLEVLFPEGTRFLQKKIPYSAFQVTEIASKLNFTLHPEDKVPVFFTAIGPHSVPLGVAIFVDPRTESEHYKISKGKVEIGVAINLKGKVKSLQIFNWTGVPEIAQPIFLKQFYSKSPNDTFKVGDTEKSIKPIQGEEMTCQLISSGIYEGLIFLFEAFGKKRKK